MKKLRNKIMLAFMLCKRLYKKPSFIAILVALTVITAAMSVFLAQDSSIVRVAIIAQNESKTATEISEKLTTSESVVAYSVQTEADAMDMLRRGDADAVWRFADNFDTALADFTAKRVKTAPIAVSVRENNIFINLTLERLYAELFPYISRDKYRDFTTEKLEVTDEAEMMEYFDGKKRNEGIIEYSYYNDNVAVESTNFLVTPLRGLLAVILTLCSMASVLYYLDDCDRGCMDAVPLSSRYTRVVMYSAAGTLNIAVFVGIALAVSGLAVGVITEIVALMLLVLGSIGFSSLVGGIICKTSRMAPLMPILMILMLVACPVFLAREIPFVSQFFAPYWYLTAVYNVSVLPQMAIYCVAVNLLAFAVWKLRALKMPAK